MSRSKRPKPKDWQKRTAADNDPTEFAEGNNYGVVLGDASSGLVDIDLDCDLARKLAPYFLPPTGWIFGRSGAPRSHYLYGSAVTQDVDESSMSAASSPSIGPTGR